MSHFKLCASQNVKRGYYPSKATGSINFKLLKAAAKRCPSMEEVSPLLEEFTDSWTHYFQDKKGTAAVCSDTSD